MTSLRLVECFRDGAWKAVSMSEIRRGDRFRLSGDDACPDGDLVAEGDAYQHPDGIWAVDVEGP